MQEGSKRAKRAVDVVIENETVAMERGQAPGFRAGSCDLDAAKCTAPPLDSQQLQPGANNVPTYLGNAVSGAITTLITRHQ